MTELENSPPARAAAAAPDMAAGYSGTRVSPAVRLPHRHAFLQLIRFPYIFTVMADILAGYLIAAESFAWMRLVWLLAAGTAIYAGGCALNDYVDRFIDLHEHPQRPIPSGRITSTFARRLAVVLFALGFSAALAAGPVASGAVAILIGLVIGYNCVFKAHDTLGPLNLGACRGMYLLLGMSAGSFRLVSAFACASLTFLYVAGLSGVSRGEVEDPRLRKAVEWMLLGIVLLDASYVAVLRGLPWSMPVAACLLPAVYFGRRWGHGCRVLH